MLLLNKALTLHRAGEVEAADAAYQVLTKAHPQEHAAWHAWGVLCYQQQRYADAIRCFGAALKLQPHAVDDLNNYALALRGAGRNHEALEILQRALTMQPADADIQLNLANTLFDLERYADALHYYRKLWHSHPSADLQQTLVYCLTKLGNSAGAEQAVVYWQEALELQSQDAALHYNLGNALSALGRTSEAVRAYQNALALNPQDADIHNNLGNALREQGAIPEAIAHYAQAYSLQPQLYHALVHWVHQKQQLCDWQGLDEAILKIRRWVREVPQARIPPFAFLAMPGSEESEHKLCASHWVAQHFSAQSAVPPPAKRAKKPITLAYLSADFRQHPLASLVSEVIEKHERRCFRVLGVSTTATDHSAERAHFERIFDDFIDIHALNDSVAAKRIRDMGSDILIDLSGFTRRGRSGLAVLRPAPVLVNWLGYAGTLGQKPNGEALFDYLLADATVIPENARLHYAEQVLYLPHCYQPHNQQRTIATPLQRSAYGLPEQGVVLCAFNQPFKITQTLFALWMRLLAAEPHAVLWLLEGHPQVMTHLRQAAKASGVDEQRLVFAPRLPMPQHLARHVHADLFLDTLPYNAHTTASDALWMGVPLLTCTGQSFAGRVATSLLHAAGLPELVTNSLQEYEEKALFYIKQPVCLEQLKVKLRARDTALFDIQSFVKALETLYLSMV